MTDEQRNEINDLAAMTENVYTLRNLVKIATDSSVSYERMLECHLAATRQAIEFLKEVLDLQERKVMSDE